MTKAKKTDTVATRKIITPAILRSWQPCPEGYKRFCELFPDGADLETAAEGLDADGHYDWAIWLYVSCRHREEWKQEAALGFKNAGHSNAGHSNAGHRNAGDGNAGDRNAGDGNAGHSNAGYGNAGDSNAGDGNVGHRNAGDGNVGHWNAGHRNAGHFNTICPNEITVFNRPCSYADWDKSPKPDFIFRVYSTRWIPESEMTDAEKVAQPEFCVMGGYTKRINFEEAWAYAWKTATANDKKLLKALPNFDADVFLEISGIDLRKE